MDEKQQPMSLSMFEPQTSIGTIIGTKKPSKPENSVSFSHTRSPSLQDSESAFKSMCLTENSNSVSKNFENKKIQKSKSGNSINQTHTENGKQSLSVEGEELSINLNENDL